MQKAVELHLQQMEAVVAPVQGMVIPVALEVAQRGRKMADILVGLQPNHRHPVQLVMVMLVGLEEIGAVQVVVVRQK